MPTLYAEIQVAGLAEPVATFDVCLDRSIDDLGMPSSTVRYPPIRATLVGLAAMVDFFTKWGADNHMRRSGWLVVYDGDQVRWRLAFYDAWCVLYGVDFRPGVDGQTAFVVELALSAALWDWEGMEIEHHSDLWWEKDYQVRKRALTPPPPLLPAPSARNLPAERQPTPPQDLQPTVNLQAQSSKPSPPQPSNSKPTKPYKNKKQYLGGDEPSKQESSRLQYLGRTPGKGSPTGKKVIKRMEAEGKIRESEESATKEVLGPDGEWYDIHKTDMGHIEDAVNWWNTEGRKHPPKGKVVRTWMLDSNNYELEPSSINRSRGAKLKQTYLPPLE